MWPSFTISSNVCRGQEGGQCTGTREQFVCIITRLIKDYSENKDTDNYIYWDSGEVRKQRMNAGVKIRAV